MTAQHWFQRTGTKVFRYRNPDGTAVTDKKLREYFASLRIPPAWHNVRIAKNKQAKILATGVDAAGRVQYIYHPTFRARQEQAKFERVLRFARALPKMRQAVDTDLRRQRLDYKKVMATVVSIMDRTYIRVGNDSYARDNGSYGLTTLRSRHTTVEGDTIKFDFVGKSGKHHVKRVTDRSLARIVRQLDNLPGYEVFKYYDYSGGGKPVLRDVKSSDVNAYIKEVMGEEFSAKDFRTWAGTLLASAELAAAGQAASARDRKKAVTACARTVARKLGNTPAVARASYIDPRLIDMFMEGGDLSQVRRAVETMKHEKGAHYLSPEERCVLQILEG